MAKKRKTWRSKLTKKEILHLKEDANCTTLDGLKRNFAGHVEMRLKHPESEPCFECKQIARKLGFPV